MLCTGAAYTIQRFCQGLGQHFAVKAYTESELTKTLGDILPKLQGCHYHDIADPAWFGLIDFKVLLEKPGGSRRPISLNNKAASAGTLSADSLEMRAPVSSLRFAFDRSSHCHSLSARHWPGPVVLLDLPD